MLLPSAVERFFTASRVADVDAWAAAFAPDAAFHHPVDTPPVRGRAAIHALISGALAGFGRFDGLTPVEAHRTGKRIAVVWRGNGANPAGAEVRWSGITVFTLDAEGLVGEAVVYGDLDSLGRQLAGETA
ncbi:nuclear transport factor 2 family protein [Streptoalloteichus hindustanus]|uniref:Ketosteroid isomerase-related protein n=1 Tax=Streptoalloteichus hindustanus TaxID=2017 RepID=A0A1M5BL45_STRHI|nr:nuclear transport factor 2 family protein [Streptoalloteichus hindustanus]SHF43251.1 Ketosteroid isomerase-related protein [Streptoalloteichus hindustanus]